MRLISKFFFLSFLILSSCANIIEEKSEFILSSKDIDPAVQISNKHVFNGFGCEGRNISPQLEWKNPPAGTKSFALTVYDPDAPTGSGWWHWVVLNIPNHYKKLSTNFGSKDQFRFKNLITQVRNDYGIHKFGGPCPPKGDKPHRYIFTLHALKTDKIILNKSATAAQAGFMINANTIGKASFVAKFGRE